MNFNLYTKVQINLYEKVQIAFEMRKKLRIWGILGRVGSLRRPETLGDWELGQWALESWVAVVPAETLSVSVRP
jgi:hypothetical protein